jgi:hypothetical protein
MRYLGDAPLEPPLTEDPGIIVFHFFPSASATAFINLCWSMAALANSLYDKLVNCQPFTVQVFSLVICINII